MRAPAPDRARSALRGTRAPAARSLPGSGPDRAAAIDDDAFHGELAGAELQGAGRGRVQRQAPLGVEQEVAARESVEAQARLWRELGSAVGQDHGEPASPAAGDTYAKSRQSSRCHRISVFAINAATQRSCSS